MSVIMTMKASADVDAYLEFVEENLDFMKEISEDAKAKGAIHHWHGVGDGFVVVVDEWESEEAFQGFFEGNERISRLMQEVGIEGEPEVAFARKIDSEDTF